MEENQALVNITYAGGNGDLAETVSRDASDAEVHFIVAEALRSGVPGIPTQEGVVDLSDFVVDRFDPTDERPFSLLRVRPKTPFGI